MTMAAGTDDAGRTLPWVISADDHVVEPPDLWDRWLPAQHRARGPRVEPGPTTEVATSGGSAYVRGADGPIADWWVFEDVVRGTPLVMACAGYPQEEYSMMPMRFADMRPGCYDPTARLADMDEGHIERSLNFPNYPRFAGQLFSEAKDKDLALACVEAWNNWMIEEWCGDSGGRLVPLIIVPLWDARLAADEVRRNAARGVRAVCYSEIPPHLGLPSIHSGEWDPFFAACQETRNVVCMHIGSSSRMPATSADAPVAVAATLSFGNAMASLSDFLFSGVLVRFPELKLAYSEGQIGWLPYILERADDVWREHRAWGGVKDIVPEPPSTYYYRQVFGCFFRDNHGLESLQRVGVDNITFETDYPHTDSTWPHTLEVAQAMMGDLPADVVYKIVRGNAIRMLGLDLDR